MKSTKHFTLIVIAAGALLGTAAPAMAGSRLYPVGDEPNASGAVWAKDLATYAVIPPDGHNYLKVSCGNLKPGETYVASCLFQEFGTWEEVEVRFGSFVADSHGRGNIGWTSVGLGWVYGPVKVYRVTDAGLQLVLSSTSP
jgi:hypothetical protein